MGCGTGRDGVGSTGGVREEPWPLSRCWWRGEGGEANKDELQTKNIYNYNVLNIYNYNVLNILIILFLTKVM